MILQLSTIKKKHHENKNYPEYWSGKDDNQNINIFQAANYRTQQINVYELLFRNNNTVVYFIIMLLIWKIKPLDFVCLST